MHDIIQLIHISINNFIQSEINVIIKKFYVRFCLPPLIYYQILQISRNYLAIIMSKRASNRNIKQTPKYQQLKKKMDQQLKNPLRNIKISSINDKNKNKQSKLKEKIQKQIINPNDKQPNTHQNKNNNIKKLDNVPDEEQPHTKSQIKKLISITSESFVMCKLTDFQNDYQIIDKIGQGSFGSVFRVKHRTLKIDRALKKIKKNPTSKFSSFQQIQVLKKLDHSNILKIYEFYQSNEYYMIVTQIFEGRQLFDQIVDLQKINEQIASKIIRQVLLTLNYTHAMNIAHRDIKPQNILIKNITDKNNFKIKIIDWGLGTLIREQFSDRVCGTPQYAAPQIFQGKYSVLCDMWSLGVLTFIMLTGSMPFKGSNTQQTISQVKRSIINYRKTGFKDLSQNAKQFITGLIQKDIGKRMTAAQALQQPWIKQHYQAKSQPIFLKQTLTRLKQLNISNHFGMAVVNLINNHFSSYQQKDKLEEIFKFLDTNGDGVLSSQQLVQGYSKIYGRQMAQNFAIQIFKKLDVNNNGTLQYSEFIAYGLRRERQKQMQKLQQAFDMFDQDKSGTISWDQVRKVLQGKIQGLYQQDMKTILKEIDENKYNQINFEQFYKFMQNLFEKVDIIRESKKRQSQIKSQSQKRIFKPIEKELKRTDSIQEIVQDKQKQKEENSLLKPIRTKRK